MTSQVSMLSHAFLGHTQHGDTPAGDHLYGKGHESTNLLGHKKIITSRDHHENAKSTT